METHTIVMTGASKGIGAIAAERILRQEREVHIVIVGRSGEPFADRVTHITADLSIVADVRAAGRRIAALLDNGTFPPLRGFVGNAGIQHVDDVTETAEGLESTFAVNVIANYVLIESLKKSFTGGSRIVITVSDTHFGDLRHNLGMVPGPRWHRPEVLARPSAFTRPDSVSAGRTAYSTSKLAAVHLVHALSRAMPAGVDVVSFNPGFVPGTDLARNARPLSRFAMKRVLPFLIATPLATSPSAAGQALADVAIGAVACVTGDYIDRRRVVPSSAESYDVERETELYEFLAGLVATPT